MRKVIIILLIISGFTTVISAKEDKEQTLAEWAAEQTKTLPETVNGVPMYRAEMAGENLLISDLLELPNTPADQVFLKALMYVKEKLDPASQEIEAIDFQNRRFTVSTKKLPGVDSQTLYSYTSAFQGTDGLLSFSCSDMKVDYKEKGLLPRNVRFEKLKPSVNERHQKWIEEQAYLFSSMIRDMRTYIPLRETVDVTNTDYILRGEVITGMTPDDVVLILGIPFSKKKSGERDKWLYESGTSVIFTDGKVSNVMY